MSYALQMALLPKCFISLVKVVQIVKSRLSLRWSCQHKKCILLVKVVHSRHVNFWD